MTNEEFEFWKQSKVGVEFYEYLNQVKEQQIEILINTTDHDQGMLARGSIQAINTILSLQPQEEQLEEVDEFNND